MMIDPQVVHPSQAMLDVMMTESISHTSDHCAHLAIRYALQAWRYPPS